MCYNVFVTSARFFRAFAPMAPRQAVLLTPSISLRLIQRGSRTQITRETPLIPVFVFKTLRTLSFSVSCKSCVCHSCANRRGVYQQFPTWNESLGYLQPDSSSLFSHSSRLFCTLAKINSFLFMYFRTLCQKHRGGGRGSIRRLTGNTRKGQEIGPGWRTGLPDPFPWQRIKRRGAVCEAS